MERRLPWVAGMVSEGMMTWVGKTFAQCRLETVGRGVVFAEPLSFGCREGRRMSMGPEYRRSSSPYLFSEVQVEVGWVANQGVCLG